MSDFCRIFLRIMKENGNSNMFCKFEIHFTYGHFKISKSELGLQTIQPPPTQHPKFEGLP